MFLKNFIHKSSTLLLQNVPIQSAMVLNNGVPTYLMDQYNRGKQSRIFHLIQDDEYDYFMVLSYNDEKAKYNHMELRNMMEYLDFKKREPAKKQDRKEAKEIKKKTVLLATVFAVFIYIFLLFVPYCIVY